MTQEEKFLLLKDLCARLPYGIVINTGDKDLKLDRQHQGIGILYPEDCSDEFNKRNNNANFYIIISGCYYGEKIKPYLRPMSGMTEEEKKELKKLCEDDLSEFAGFITNGHGLSHDGLYMFDKLRQLEFCLSHHIDFRLTPEGLSMIEAGLALEAPEGMYGKF